MKRKNFLAIFCVLCAIIEFIIIFQQTKELFPTLDGQIGHSLFFMLMLVFFEGLFVLIFRTYIPRPKSRFLSELIENPTTPVYKLNERDDSVWKYELKYSYWDKAWIIIFPLMALVDFDYMEGVDYYYPNKEQLKKILDGTLSLEDFYQEKEAAFKSRRDAREELTKRVNKVNESFYKNFKQN